MLYMFRVVLPPIIRSAYNYIYSIWYLSHRYCYLPLSWKNWNRFECAAGGELVWVCCWWRSGRHHHRIQINYQLYATISPVYCLRFIYRSTCIGRLHSHHQELNNCSSILWFYRWSVVVAVLLVVVGPAGNKLEKLLHLVGNLFQFYDNAKT
jgi:hypothetical protein